MKIIHKAITTGYCGSVTTFSGWNSAMVVQIFGYVRVRAFYTYTYSTYQHSPPPFCCRKIVYRPSALTHPLHLTFNLHNPFIFPSFFFLRSTGSNRQTHIFNAICKLSRIRERNDTYLRNLARAVERSIFCTDKIPFFAFSRDRFMHILLLDMI
jgi:hypothetical protein